MATYKNSELYQLAFNLAIKIYKLNVMLPPSGLLHKGNHLRWMSLRIKDLIAESYAPQTDLKKQIRNFNQMEKLSQDILIQLKKISNANLRNKQIPAIMGEYLKLIKILEEQRTHSTPQHQEYIIPFNESRVMEMAG